MSDNLRDHFLYPFFVAGHDFSMSFPGLMRLNLEELPVDVRIGHTEVVPGAVLEFVSTLPGRTEARELLLRGNDPTKFVFLGPEVYLDTDYSFWFFKPEDLRSTWHASEPQKLSILVKVTIKTTHLG